MGSIEPRIEDSWKDALQAEFNSPYFGALKAFLVEEKKHYCIFPPGGQIFHAFNRTPLHAVKAVIIGQDPYHGEGQAHGLCFSVKEGVKAPPSLVNIFKELNRDLGLPIPASGNLEKWAGQGVLLLNATLTVRANQAGSHQNKGWEQFTDAVIRKISSEKEGVVFLLWGNYAKKKAELIDKTRHHILTAAHPSPLAGGAFSGCGHFSRTNELLKAQGKEPIDWSL